ncbi:MAG TPA: hypothetical protein PLV45_13045 [bacterium]|nr:hypothetical protein [bacterium]
MPEKVLQRVHAVAKPENTVEDILGIGCCDAAAAVAVGGTPLVIGRRHRAQDNVKRDLRVFRGNGAAEVDITVTDTDIIGFIEFIRTLIAVRGNAAKSYRNMLVCETITRGMSDGILYCLEAKR